MLGFRYWMDEPGNDVMWYFSENHALLFHAACYLAGSLFPDATFVRSGRKGAKQAEIGRARVHEWFDRFEADELAEWNSAPYFPIDFKGLAALAALAPDGDVKARAERAIRRLLEIVALSSHQGMLTASQGRSYEHSLCPATTLELSSIARLFFGRGGFGSHVHALPLLALLVLEHGFSPDPRLERARALAGGRRTRMVLQAGAGRRCRALSPQDARSRDGKCHGLSRRRVGLPGNSVTSAARHATANRRSGSIIRANGTSPAARARPIWGGCGTLPRVQQYCDVAIANFDAKPDQVDFTHAWMPESEMDEIAYAGDRVAVRAGNGLALLIGSASFVRVANGPTAGCEIRLMGRHTRWLVRLSDCDREGSLPRLSSRVSPTCARPTVRRARFGLTTLTTVVSSFR